MKMGRKFISTLTALSLFGSCSAVPAYAAETPPDDNITQALESGTENMEVYVIYKNINKEEIISNAKALTNEYAESLDKSSFINEHDYEFAVSSYYEELVKEKVFVAKDERINAVLTELGINRENAYCDTAYPRITCTLTPEQLSLAEKSELITHVALMSEWKTAEELGIETTNISPTVSLSKVDRSVTQAIEKGMENLKVYLFYTVNVSEIAVKAKVLADEYVKTLDTEMYDYLEIDMMKDEYKSKYEKETVDEAKREKQDSILTTLGLNPEDVECDLSTNRITCTLTAEQITAAADSELVSGISLTAGAVTPEILPVTLEQLVAEDDTFSNNAAVYSDKYKFALEQGVNGDVLVVYGIPAEDCYGGWRNHIVTNSQYTYVMVDWFPAGENRSVYSGFTYDGVISTNSSFKLEKPIDVMFFVNNEVPYYAKNVDDASEQIGFDISPYIYSDNVTSIEYNVPEDAEPTKYGDITSSGSVNIADLVKLNQFLLNSEEYPLTDVQKANADCCKDGVIDANDCTTIMNYVCMVIGEEELGK